ncbi:MAG: ATP-binding cassette domain-containing protein [Bdellovibrionales bacterium]|nr:ATP-binding cassette domain-containing protein [Bdellovibrionales bacterium]
MILEVRNIHNRFGEQVVHSGLSFTIEKPEYIALIGGSGTGKSVLLKQIIGLTSPNEGEIKIFGKSPQEVFSSEGIRKTPVGMLFQQGALFSSLNVIENVEAPLREHTDLDLATIRKVAKLKLDLAAYPLSAATKMPSELSGGMLKRAALARALVLEPKLLLCDEPVSGLDPINARAFDHLMLTLTKYLKITALTVTHDLSSVMNYAMRVIAFAEGKILADGTAEELSKVEHPWLTTYLSSGD